MRAQEFNEIVGPHTVLRAVNGRSLLMNTDLPTSRIIFYHMSAPVCAPLLTNSKQFADRLHHHGGEG
jgi:hypothetical protein